MRASRPFWQGYWYELRFRRVGTHSFESMGPGGLQPVPNKWLTMKSIDEFADWILAQGVDELDDLHGELRVLIYTEATLGPETDPMLVRTVELGRRR